MSTDIKIKNRSKRMSMWLQGAKFLKPNKGLQDIFVNNLCIGYVITENKNLLSPAYERFGQTVYLKNRLRITNNHYQSMTSVILKMKVIIKSAIWLTVILVTLRNGIYVLENFVKQFITS